MGDRYFIERYGGFAGLKATGAVDGDALNPGDRQTLEQLLATEETLTSDAGQDRYRYVVRRENAAGSTTREIPESLMPHAVANVVKADI